MVSLINVWYCVSFPGPSSRAVLLEIGCMPFVLTDWSEDRATRKGQKGSALMGSMQIMFFCLTEGPFGYSR